MKLCMKKAFETGPKVGQNHTAVIAFKVAVGLILELETYETNERVPASDSCRAVDVGYIGPTTTVAARLNEMK